uniref:Uncharacterized protein n=1 Tax=Glossina palpalis gambiensis TaxID=67801 RepID=A0A1B0AUC6_9MUSC
MIICTMMRITRGSWRHCCGIAGWQWNRSNQIEHGIISFISYTWVQKTATHTPDAEPLFASPSLMADLASSSSSLSLDDDDEDESDSDLDRDRTEPAETDRRECRPSVLLNGLAVEYDRIDSGCMLMIGAESYLRKDNEDTGETPKISENEENYHGIKFTSSSRANSSLANGAVANSGDVGVDHNVCSWHRISSSFCCCNIRCLSFKRFCSSSVSLNSESVSDSEARLQLDELLNGVTVDHLFLPRFHRDRMVLFEWDLLCHVYDNVYRVG